MNSEMRRFYKRFERQCRRLTKFYFKNKIIWALKINQCPFTRNTRKFSSDFSPEFRTVFLRFRHSRGHSINGNLYRFADTRRMIKIVQSILWR